MLHNPVQEKLDVLLKKIRSIRLEKQISQNEISKRLNISQNAYCKMEQGKTKLDLYRFVQINNILEFDFYKFFKEN
tara:strand:- start:733 stop:960 length:228 start_codon:yes stop_codon:yes gene_type:complete